MNSCCPVLELRQYTLHGGQRDTLIELFEREFVVPQERLGIRVLGQFRDLDDPDRFVWLRGFESMQARAEALDAFYTGAVWRSHREAANATMLDSDNVLLLQPARPEAALPTQERNSRAAGVLIATIHYLSPTRAEAYARFFRDAVRPRLEHAGAMVLAEWVSETTPNNFPALPVRAGEAVFVWISRFEDEERHAAFARRWRQESGWRDAAPPELLPALMRKPEVLRLAPTPLSALR